MNKDLIMDSRTNPRKATSLKNRTVSAIQKVHIQLKCMMRGQRGEAYVDMAVKILIGVVIGALLLGGLYSLFSDSVLPKLTQKINGMFDYTTVGQ